jgi:uncharacterized protein (TIGR02444 family)
MSLFWEFSLGFYARESVAPACLQLQDEGGADVNLLLYLLFLADRRLVAKERDIATLDKAVAPWREEAVRPLRDLRKRLKHEMGAVSPAERETFRNLVKKVELESERLQQLALEREGARLRLESAASREEAAWGNIHAYSAYLGGLPDNAVKTVLMAFTLSPPSCPGDSAI